MHVVLVNLFIAKIEWVECKHEKNCDSNFLQNLAEKVWLTDWLQMAVSGRSANIYKTPRLNSVSQHGFFHPG